LVHTLVHRAWSLTVLMLLILILTISNSTVFAADLGTVIAQQKISSTEGGFEGELGDRDEFGTSTVKIGDLDGDGVSDLAVGAAGCCDDDSVWILFMNADGTVKSEQKISSDVFSAFGSAVADLGDFDGDGIPDLAVGARCCKEGSEGSIWLLFLNRDGTVKAQQEIGSGKGGFTGELKWQDSFGSSIANLGDLDGDGVIDLAVGAAGDDGIGTPEFGSFGAIWILFLNENGTVKAQRKINHLEGGFTGDLDAHDAFGHSIANLGDFDGDGVTDIVVGAPGDDDGGGELFDAGAIWILLLNANGTVKSHRKISNTEGGFNGGLGENDSFGWSAANMGDIDGDGVVDLAVGAYSDADGGSPNAGAVYILFLNSDGTVKSHQQITEGVGGFSGGSLSHFGWAVANIGDFNGDGSTDMAVGENEDDDGGRNRGAIWILFLSNGDDISPPICKLVSVTPPSSALIGVWDGDSGLSTIVVLTTDNLTVSVAPFTPGTTDPVAVTLTRVDDALPIVISLEVTDMEGNSRVCSGGKNALTQEFTLR